MKKLLLLMAISPSFAFAEADLTIYMGEGCPHCAYASQWVDNFYTKAYPNRTVEEIEVWNSRENMQIFLHDMQKRGLTVKGVPTFVIEDEKVLVGTQMKEIERELSLRFGEPFKDLTIPEKHSSKKVKSLTIPANRTITRTLVEPTPQNTSNTTPYFTREAFKSTINKPKHRYSGTISEVVRKRLQERLTKRQMLWQSQ